MNFAESFNEVLASFASHEVDFLVVGGYAVNFYGFDRTTSDLDIWINPVESNKQKIYSALVSIGYPEEATKQVFELNFKQPCCFRLGDDKWPVDIFTHMVGVNYEEASAEKILFQTDTKIAIYFISLRHLIVNKQKAGRDKDKIDVDALQKILQLKK